MNLDRECEVEARGAETDGFQGDDLESPEIARSPEKCLYRDHNNNVVAESFYLTVFSYADWAGNRDDLTSILAFVMLLGSNPISWCSKKKCSICPFVYEAKYHAIAFAIVDFKLDV
ncbi:hypothetical protein WN944_008227 [Citrus x changshan-huyou]|uniref:Uncharacterized protein n=1 Tax=Citrus x changshan-huyou TaxID=2935761 RepID=A0AAP0MTV8_9ROSI